MWDFYEQFIEEGFDDKGQLCSFSLKLKEDFNFGYDVIDELARRCPHKKMLHWVNDHGGDVEFDYEQMSRLTNKCANMLLDHGVKKGDMVLAVLKRHYEFWILAYGLIKIGAVLIPATSQLMPKDYIYRFNAAGVKYICATYFDEVADRIDTACGKYDGIKEKFICRGKKDGWTDFMEELEKYPDTLERQEVSKDDYMLAYFSSGTTGQPKMAIHANEYAMGSVTTARYWHHVDENSVHLTVSESGWAKCAWGKMFGQLVCGAEEFIYDMDRFHPEKMLTVLQNYNITSFCAPPTMYRFFIKEGLGNYDLSGIKYSCIAGEALNAEVFNKWKEYTGLDLMEGFGQSESVVIVANFFGMKPKPGSMGKPSPFYDVDIIRKDGSSCGTGETGEIIIRAERGKHPALFREYYRNEELTGNAWRGGVYHTGDTAYRDEDGYFWYVGRTDDLIKASGYRIGPFEIESILMEHPAVMEVAVTAADDEIRGKVVKATIVLSKNYSPSQELVKELQNHVKRSTAPYKYPRIVEFVSELPKTDSGKIRRVEIRENDHEKYKAAHGGQQ
ncbi:MAG: AMP-binding protein [Ruminococcus sp.]|nr:AMP-binding protein [Ruminococcus sp.]